MARITPNDIGKLKRRGERIPMLTAYDYLTARIVEAAGIPMILVGDSVGTTILGYETTIPVTLEDILHHTRAVVRGTQRALIVADLPFLTYRISPAEALRNAGRLLQEGGAQAVKLEGGQTVAETVRTIVDNGIPVMGHLGLTPQSVYQLGGHRLQARGEAAAKRLIEDAQALEAAGAFAVVLELIPAPLAEEVTRTLRIPTIGIGAGPACDGQVQVITDLLGLDAEFQPRHARRYAHLSELIGEAVSAYASDVRAQTFPSPSESFGLATSSGEEKA